MAKNLQFSHVDIVVDNLNEFIAKWCPVLGFYSSEIQIWGDAGTKTHCEYVYIFNEEGKLMFIAVEGKHGSHVDILKKYGHGTIYRLCFKTNYIEETYENLITENIKIVDIDGNLLTLDNVLNKNNGMMWLENEGNLSLEILKQKKIDETSKKLWDQIGLEKKKNCGDNYDKTKFWISIMFAGAIGFALGRLSLKYTLFCW